MQVADQHRLQVVWHVLAHLQAGHPLRLGRQLDWCRKVDPLDLMVKGSGMGNLARACRQHNGAWNHGGFWARKT